MVRPGDVVIVDFSGAMLMKARPVVVISSARYHQERPDVIVGLLTTNIAAATASSDYVLRDWQQAGLRKPSAFRTFLTTDLRADVQIVGHLSSHDWQGVWAAVNGSIG